MKTAFVAPTRVQYTTSDGRYLRGEVVGPDQKYFPSPGEVFVSLAATGRTCLLPVTDLTIDPPSAQLHNSHSDGWRMMHDQHPASKDRDREVWAVTGVEDGEGVSGLGR